PLHRLHILTASFRALDLDLIVDLFLQLHLLLFDYTSTTHFYTLSLHDALPIFEIFFLKKLSGFIWMRLIRFIKMNIWNIKFRCKDRKSTRLNSSHVSISYALFCLKKKTHSIHSYRSLSISRIDATAAYSLQATS